jgi:hypothetical protein
MPPPVSILDLATPSAYIDTTFADYQVRVIKPLANTSYGYSDEIRIPINLQDGMIALPHECMVHIEGVLTKSPDTSQAMMCFNSPSYLFDSVRLEIGGIEIDRCKNVGVTSTMRHYLTLRQSDLNSGSNSGCHIIDDIPQKTVDVSADGYFDVCIPLRTWLGYIDDWKRVLINARGEVIFIRSGNDRAVLYGTSAEEASKITITSMTLRLPFIKVYDEERINILKRLKNNDVITMPFRTYDLYEYPAVPTNSEKFSWTIKTSSGAQVPSYLVIGFQENPNEYKTPAHKYNHQDVEEYRGYLNTNEYPYTPQYANFTKERFAVPYDEFSKFHSSYNNRLSSGDPITSSASSVISRKLFKAISPLYVVDCSAHEKLATTGAVDVRIEVSSAKVFPQGTTCYCLIIHDRVVQYYPLTNEVRKII